MDEFGGGAIIPFCEKREFAGFLAQARCI